jgi:hypothetical protein
VVDGKVKAPALRALQVALRNLDKETVGTVRECVAAVLDHTMHDFLFALAESEGGVTAASNGLNVATASDALQGEPYGERGWIARFSRHPGP